MRINSSFRRAAAAGRSDGPFTGQAGAGGETIILSRKSVGTQSRKNLGKRRLGC